MLNVYGEDVFLNLIFQAAMLHGLPKIDHFSEKFGKMQGKHDFMTCSDVIPAKWHMIQYSTEFGKVLQQLCHFIADLEPKIEFCEKNKVISRHLYFLGKGSYELGPFFSTG